MLNRPTPQILWWTIKAFALVHLIALAAQPVLFGQHFGGDPDALALHATTGRTVAWLALGQAVLGLVSWRRGLLRPAAALVLVVIFVLDGVQLHLGFARVVGVHIPLGTALFAVSFSATLWLWCYAAGPAQQLRSSVQEVANQRHSG